MPVKNMKTFTVSEVIGAACEMQGDKKHKKWNSMCDEIDLCNYEVKSHEFHREDLKRDLKDEESNSIQNKALLYLMSKYRIKELRVIGN